MSNTQSVPDPEVTRDMLTVASETSYERPPYAAALAGQCFSQLHDLERWFGTEVLAEALKRYDVDPGFGARRRGLDPARLVRDIESVYAGLELPAYAAGMVAKARSLPVSAAFPGATTVPVQAAPTAAYAA